MPLTPCRYLPVLMIWLCFLSCRQPSAPLSPYLPVDSLALHYFGSDSAWFKNNIPFFECSDTTLQSVYYYRWKMFKAHIREVGTGEWVITEFINHVAWDREPFCTINAASMHHIYEGRWLHNADYIKSYIDYLHKKSGNNRAYSESIADATWNAFLVNGDSAFASDQLNPMIQQYNAWNDHWETAKQLYYIPAMPDATEYNIASVDASGGTAGFEGGDAFRPTINSYMWANAMAIAKLATLKKDSSTAQLFLQKADNLRQRLLRDLWNDSLHHFTDRYKITNKFVTYWHFIRGRELAGIAPWYFNLPPDNARYNEAWTHLLDSTQLLGPYGFRTNEPSYEYYFKQFVWYEGKRGSQWNGPSWPFQSSIALTGMANLLHRYKNHVVTNSDYLKLLRLYSRQHYLPDGELNLVENYDPNLGGPIVHYEWSNHYNHSSYNNLIISGFCGVNPAAGDSIVIHPLIDSSIQYFALTPLAYHGHELSIWYDRDGKKYPFGKGLHVWIDGKKATGTPATPGLRFYIGPVTNTPVIKHPNNLALNIKKNGYPRPEASVNNVPDSLFAAVDGRAWSFPEVKNWWSTTGNNNKEDWFQVTFEKPEKASRLATYFMADDRRYFLPDSIRLEYWDGGNWQNAAWLGDNATMIIANKFETRPMRKCTTDKIRLRIFHTRGPIALSELRCW